MPILAGKGVGKGSSAGTLEAVRGADGGAVGVGAGSGALRADRPLSGGGVGEGVGTGVFTHILEGKAVGVGQVDDAELEITRLLDGTAVGVGAAEGEFLRDLIGEGVGEGVGSGELDVVRILSAQKAVGSGRGSGSLDRTRIVDGKGVGEGVGEGSLTIVSWSAGEVDTRATETIEEKEFQADFETGSQNYDGTSTKRRPDTVSLDYLRSWSWGPTAQQDTSEGLLDRTWYVRTDGTNIWLAKANDIGDAWDSETLLFTVSDGFGDIEEIDLAFTQNADPVVVAQRPTGSGGASELWIYYFDPTIPDFDFQNFGEGRNPRCFLDNPRDEEDSDVLIFYVNDTDGFVNYRQQRDRYATEYNSDLSADEDRYLEEVVRNRSGRIGLIYSDRDQGTGTYSLGFFWSALYPHIADPDAMDLDSEILDASFIHAIIVTAGGPGRHIDPEALDLNSEIIDARFIPPLTISESGPDAYIDDEALDVDSEVLAASFVEIIFITETGPDGYIDNEAVDVDSEILSAVFIEVLLPTLDDEALDIDSEILSATLSTP